MTFSVQHGSVADKSLLVMHCTVSRNHVGHVVLSGRVNGEERLRCDMSTTYREHPDRFARECESVALNRLREIAVEMSRALAEDSFARIERSIEAQDAHARRFGG